MPKREGKEMANWAFEDLVDRFSPIIEKLINENYCEYEILLGFMEAWQFVVGTDPREALKRLSR